MTSYLNAGIKKHRIVTDVGRKPYEVWHSDPSDTKQTEGARSQKMKLHSPAATTTLSR